ATPKNCQPASTNHSSFNVSNLLSISCGIGRPVHVGVNISLGALVYDVAEMISENV
ncbi:hypothetical protein PanWU01x14_253680, partial [Parasponia andersonii]